MKKSDWLMMQKLSQSIFIRKFSSSSIIGVNSFLAAFPHQKASSFFQPVESEGELLLDSIHREETAPLDLDKRSLYFSVQESNSLRLFPGSWIQVSYRNSKSSSANATRFGGVLLSLHDNWINSKFTLLGVLDEIPVMMQFYTFSPLIEAFFIHRRSIPTRTMEYLWSESSDFADLNNLLQHPSYCQMKSNSANENDAEIIEASTQEPEYNVGISNPELKEMLLRHDEAVGKRSRRRQVEEISMRTAGLDFKQRMAMKLPEEIPPGYNKRWDSDEVERYLDNLVGKE